MRASFSWLILSSLQPSEGLIKACASYTVKKELTFCRPGSDFSGQVRGKVGSEAPICVTLHQRLKMTCEREDWALRLWLPVALLWSPCISSWSIIWLK